MRRKHFLLRGSVPSFDARYADLTSASLLQYREANQDVSPSYENVLQVDGAKDSAEVISEILEFLRS